jgi:hypothetical protein
VRVLSLDLGKISEVFLPLKESQFKIVAHA